MTNGFPPTAPRPTYYLHITGTTRYNTWYVGDTGLTFTLSHPTGGAVTATGYLVRDWYGTVVASATFASGTTALTIADPAGGWQPGWYRLYLSGANSETVFGPSYGVTNFQVIRPNAHFPTMPSRSAPDPSNAGAPVAAILRGVCGIGPVRYAINNTASPATDIADIQGCLTVDASYYANPSYQDAARPREQLVSFPNTAYDVVGIGGLRAFAKTPGTANIYVQVATGTTSGFKVTVATPNAATVVETYDNKADVPAVIAASAGSAYVVFTGGGATGVGGPFAISTAAYLGVKQTVTALYPAVKWFEGPSNEPTEDGTATTAQAMRAFAAAVHDGAAGAKALGPNHVSENFGATAMNTFLANGGGNYCDGLSYHAYGMVAGDLNLARATYPAFMAVLANYASQTASKPIWQTEQGVQAPINGTFMPRKSRWQMLQLLIQEQYGVPRERNYVWYDVSHGFWASPMWLLNGDYSPQPQVTMIRVLAEEAWGKQHEAALNFGDPGGRIFLGSSYSSPSDGTRTLVMMATSPLDNPAIVLSLTGAPLSSVTTVDAFGRTATSPVTSGQVTVNVADVPTYVRLPAGVTATVRQVSGWPAAASTRLSIANPANFVAAIASQGATRANFQPLTSITSGVYQIAGYTSNNCYESAVTAMPDWVQIHWVDHPNTFDRVIIWSGIAFQAQCTLLKFDVQTSNDGTTWTTQASVDKTASAISFEWGSDDQNTGTTADTFWPEQWVHDVPLPTQVRASYLRILVYATSMGGAPDAISIQAGNQADDGNQRVTISQLGIYSDDSLIPRYATR